MTRPPPGGTAVLPLLPRRLAVLCVSQVVGSMGLAAGAVAGPLLAATVTGSIAYGPLPLGLLVVGSALAAPVATAAMRRWGRARGLAGCHLAAAAGAAVVIADKASGLAALVVGSLLLGVGNVGVMLGRYAAADVAPAGRQAQALSLAVTAVSVGAVAGPFLLGPAGWPARSLGLPPASGLYLVALAMFPLAALIVLSTDRVAAPARPPSFAVAGALGSSRLYPLLVLGLANLTMVSLMGAMPNHLHHHGWQLSEVGMVIGVHVAAMFGPSPLTGLLIWRLGYHRVSLLGVATTLLAVLAGLGPRGAGWDVALLVLLGLGWNLQLLSGSAWLVETTPRHLRHRTEGWGEVVMGLAAAAGTLGLAGPLLVLGGLPAMCAVLGVLNVAALIACPQRRGGASGDAVRTRPRRPESRPA